MTRGPGPLASARAAFARARRTSFVAFVLASVCGSVASAQDELDALIRRVETEPLVDRFGGVSPAGEELSEQLRARGAAAIPRLLPLLESPREPARALTGFILSGIDGLEERDLDALLHACASGNGWIPPAIGRIGTPRAIEFLVEALVAHPQPMSQFTSALQLSGAHGACELVKPLRNGTPLEREYSQCLDEVLNKLGARAAPAIDPLVEVACGRQFLLAHRQFALSAIGSIGIAARRATPALRTLAVFEPEAFAEEVEDALVAIGGPEAVEILVQRLRAHPRNSTLQDLAELGEAARSAAPLVADLLENPQLRATAAETLGWLGDAGCASALLSKLVDDDDWLVVDKTSEALGRLHATSALSALQSVAERHWFARVRRSAAKAIDVIRGVSEYDDAYAESEALIQQEERPDSRGTLPALMPGPGQLSADELAKRTYPFEFRSYGSDGRLQRKPKVQRAQCGLIVAEGELLGASRGEWGGELVQVRTVGSSSVGLDDNVVGVHRTATGIVAVAGIAHLSLNYGALYRVEARPDGTFTSTWWKRLPGAPIVSGFLEGGSLVIRCLDGDVLLTTGGELAESAPR